MGQIQLDIHAQPAKQSQRPRNRFAGGFPVKIAGKTKSSPDEANNCDWLPEGAVVSKRMNRVDRRRSGQKRFAGRSVFGRLGGEANAMGFPWAVEAENMDNQDEIQIMLLTIMYKLVRFPEQRGWSREEEEEMPTGSQIRCSPYNSGSHYQYDTWTLFINSSNNDNITQPRRWIYVSYVHHGPLGQLTWTSPQPQLEVRLFFLCLPPPASLLPAAIYNHR